MLRSESSSSDEEESLVSLVEKYKIVDIKSGLLNPTRYCTAVAELTTMINYFYATRDSTKPLRRLIEEDVHSAIFEYPGGDFPKASLRKLMLEVSNTFPQAKRQILCREYKQKMLQVLRDAKREDRQRQQQLEEGEQIAYSYADLPPECIENILSLIQDPYTLARAACTCTTWRNQAFINTLWRPFVFLTFGDGNITVIEKSEHIEKDVYYKTFSKVASSDEYKNTELVLPWRTDRIFCHNTVRWISSETKARAWANTCGEGISLSQSKSKVAFLTPNDVAFFIQAKNGSDILSMWCHDLGKIDSDN